MNKLSKYVQMSTRRGAITSLPPDGRSQTRERRFWRNKEIYKPDTPLRVSRAPLPLIQLPVVRSNQCSVGYFSRLSKARFDPLLYLCLLLLTCYLTACVSLPAKQSAKNQASVQQAPKARLTYVAIGASDTFGIGTDDPQTQSWPVVLAGKLAPDVRLINLGIPGIEAHGALTAELPVAIDAHPDLVTVWLAVNDLADNVSPSSYAHDLDQLLGRLRAAVPHARIAVANVPDLTLLPRFRGADTQALHAKISTYNAIIASTVGRYHAILVDLYQQWRSLADHPDYISSDGFHPNAFGYAALAELFFETLQKTS